MTNTDKKETSICVPFIDGALSKIFHEYLGVCILLLCTLLYSCKSVENKQLEKNKSSFIVKSVKKHKNGVYVIYAYRNDSIFKIVSYYDGMKHHGGKRLVKGTCFDVSLQSVFAEYERKNNILPPCNEFMEFRGVAIGKEPKHGIDDVWFCKDLNGPFLVTNEKKLTIDR